MIEHSIIRQYCAAMIHRRRYPDESFRRCILGIIALKSLKSGPCVRTAKRGQSNHAGDYVLRPNTSQSNHATNYDYEIVLFFVLSMLIFKHGHEV